MLTSFEHPLNCNSNPKNVIFLQLTLKFPTKIIYNMHIYVANVFLEILDHYFLNLEVFLCATYRFCKSYNFLILQGFLYFPLEKVGPHIKGSF